MLSYTSAILLEAHFIPLRWGMDRSNYWELIFDGLTGTNLLSL